MRKHALLGRCAFLALTALLGAAALSQEPLTSPAPDASLTQDEVKTQLAIVQAAADLPDESKKKAVQLYNQALAQLEAAQEWKQKAAEFEQARLEAPARLETQENQLAELPEEAQPDVPADATLGQLEQELVKAEAELAASKERLQQLQDEPDRRAERRRQIPASMADIEQKLRDLRSHQDTPPLPDEAAEVAAARRVLASARIKALNAEKKAYEEELLSYEARSRLLTLRRDLAVREVARQEARVKAWRETAALRRQEETEKASVEARQALLKTAEMSPLVRDFAEEIARENQGLVEERTGPDGLVRKIDRLARKNSQLEQALTEIQNTSDELRTTVETVGLNNATGMLLRESARDLPDLRDRQREIRRRTDVVADAQFKKISLREQRTSLADIQALVDTTVEGLAPAASEQQRQDLGRVLRELYTAKRTYLDALLGDYENYLNLLLDIQLTEQKLVDQTQQLATFIDEHVLWVRSGMPLGRKDVNGVWNGVLWLATADHWIGAARSLGADAVANLVLYVLFALLLVALVVLRPGLVAHIRKEGEEAQKRICLSIKTTAAAILYSVAASLIAPAALAFVAWRLSAAGQSGAFEQALASALLAVAGVGATLAVTRTLLRPKGIAEAHFGWPGAPLCTLRKGIGRLAIVALPAVFLVTLLEAPVDKAVTDSLCKVLLTATMAAFAVFAHGLFRPDRGAVDRILRGAIGTLPKGYRLLHVAAVVVPLSLAVLAGAGYVYTALRLSWRFHNTVVLCIAVLVVRGFVLRWLTVAHRRMARDQARKRREAVKTEAAETEGSEVEESPPEVDLAKVDAQTASLLKSVLTIVLILGLWFIWADVLPALGFLNRVEIGRTIETVSETSTGPDGQTIEVPEERVVPITLAHFGLAILFAFLTLVFVRNVPGLLEMLVLQRLAIGSGERYAIITLLRYALIISGIILAFGAIGVGWGKVQWLIAAMGVGLGFGLQEIFANFISGIIILFERPIRLGDTVTVGGISGTVTQIRMRATRITDWDRKELIVPNKEFVTGQLVNWSLSDSILRVIIPVGIAYGSDTEKAVRALRAVAANHPLVLDDPAPQVLFLEFGGSSLNFELRVFCASIATFLTIKHELHLAIDKAFREAGIEIAFPQHDVHIRSIKDALPLVDKRKETPD